MRIIQPGAGARRHVLVGYYCQASIHEMATALPSALVLSIDEAHPGVPLRRDELVAKAVLVGADELGEICLIGWSAGCHGVRDALPSVRPEVVIALDGTHGSIPQPGTMPLDPWRALIRDARMGKALFIASHTYLLYTDHLPKGQAFMATAHVLRDLTGWPLEEPADPKRPAVRRSGDLVVYSWQSGDVDGAAHVRQVREAGPLLVRDWLAPRWESEAPDTSAETTAGLLASAAQGASEALPLQVATAPAADASTGQGEALSHGYRCGVAEIKADAVALGRWHSAADVHAGRYRPKVGDLILSTRPGGMHVERATEAPTGNSIMTIGGNESNRWIEASYDLRSAAFDGVVEVAPGLGARAVTVARGELGKHVAEIPGPQANVRISEYHAGARRGGTHLAGMPGHEHEGVQTLGDHTSDEVAWCASAASRCAYQAAR